MKTRLVASAVFSVLWLLGCGGGNPMVGTWKLEMTDAMKKQMPAGSKMDMGLTFAADDTFAVNGEVMGQKVSGKGTYKLEEKKLTMTTTEMNGTKTTTNNTQSVDLSDDKKSFTLPGGAKMVKQ